VPPGARASTPSWIDWPGKTVIRRAPGKVVVLVVLTGVIVVVLVVVVGTNAWQAESSM
jgi:hypothetical protein